MKLGSETFRRGCSAFIVLLVLTFLPVTLDAKCPTYLVNLRGRIERSLQSGDRVLAALDFSDRRPRSSWDKVTVLGIHGSRFDGHITYSTFSSSFLGGDKCHRQPKR